ncbi:dormancy-associated protein 1-like isoform X2 [Cynara cardunculus var. scolymus]|uniref:dormancy-associated protein 1-like isoform X2 n=1 Tax=Cynara cardunculus var. scolymus TaxID=59895 RepID=UPI000D62BF2A|nr:dormancy-associated protein 1-like isoform X2 [Cynara cardunculus var. scolymus]
MWDEVVAGPQPNRGLGKLRKLATFNGLDGSSSNSGSISVPSSPTTPGTPTNTSPTAARKDNVWRSVFNPGSNPATRDIGSNRFDKPNNPGSPTIYDWMYSGASRSKYR